MGLSQGPQSGEAKSWSPGYCLFSVDSWAGRPVTRIGDGCGSSMVLGQAEIRAGLEPSDRAASGSAVASTYGGVNLRVPVRAGLTIVWQ